DSFWRLDVLWPCSVVLEIRSVTCFCTESSLVLLCYVESMIFGGKFVPQQGQHPIKRINHGCIACKTFSHVTPEVFFRTQVDHHDKEVSNCCQYQVMVKALPKPAL